MKKSSTSILFKYELGKVQEVFFTLLGSTGIPKFFLCYAISSSSDFVRLWLTPLFHRFNSSPVQNSHPTVSKLTANQMYCYIKIKHV